MTGDTAEQNAFRHAASPELMDANTYHALLQRLVLEGQGYGKTQPVAAFLLPNLRIVTSMSSGDDETMAEVPITPTYLVMDLRQYPNGYVQKLVVQDILAKYAAKVVGVTEINDPDFKGAGLWTSKQSSFETDYIADDGNKNQFNPNPAAYRVCLSLDETIVIPTPWGEPFTIQKGGTLAIRESDIRDLITALENIRSGDTTAEDALLDEEGKSKFDVYGMEPEFLVKNYDPITLKDTTREVITHFSARADQQGQKLTK